VETVVLDANPVIGFLEPTDALHEQSVKELVPWLGRNRARLMPATVYAEVLVHPIRDGQAQVIDDFIARAGIELIDVDRPLARLAAELQARWEGLQLGDALVVSTAVHHRAELLTFDADLWHRWDLLR